MKGGAATDAAKRELLACQNDYDAWKEQHQGERVTLQTEDNIRLSGLLYDQGGKETVVYLHNIGSAAGEDFYYAPWYWEKGYNILMPDNRAHGESEGNCASYGVYEAEDVNQCSSLFVKNMAMTADNRTWRYTRSSCSADGFCKLSGAGSLYSRRKSCGQSV